MEIANSASKQLTFHIFAASFRLWKPIGSLIVRVHLTNIASFPKPILCNFWFFFDWTKYWKLDRIRGKTSNECRWRRAPAQNSKDILLNVHVLFDLPIINRIKSIVFKIQRQLIVSLSPWWWCYLVALILFSSTVYRKKNSLVYLSDKKFVFDDQPTFFRLMYCTCIVTPI